MQKKPKPSILKVSSQASLSSSPQGSIANLHPAEKLHRKTTQFCDVSQSSELFQPNEEGKNTERPRMRYSSMGNIPIIIKDQEYFNRKQTFDTFLRMKDLEIMLGFGSQNGTPTIHKNTSINTVNLLHSKTKNELSNKLKFKKGKMYTNELWSMEYYSEVISDSNLKRKFENLSSLKLKPVETKLQEVEETVQKKIRKSFNEAEQSLAKLRDISAYPSSRMTSLQVLELSPVRKPFEPKSESPTQMSPTFRLHRKDNEVKLETMGTIRTNRDHLSSMFTQKPLLRDFSDSSLMTNRRSHREKKKLSLFNSQEDFGTYFEGAKGMTVYSTVTTPVNSPLTKGKKTSIFRGSPVCASPSLRTPKTLNSLKGPRYNESREVRFSKNTSLEALDPINNKQDSIMKFTSRTPREASEESEVQKKVKALIKNCIYLNNQNKYFKKEIIQGQNDLEAYSKRRELEKIKGKKTKVMVDSLKEKADYFRAQRQQRMEVAS